MKKNTEMAVEKTVAAIFALDLDPIKFKLMSKEDGYGWTQAKADHYEQEYKRFLSLVVKFPEESIVPSVNVDKFWHAHILDTMKYAEDCDKVFGYFLHHYPYFGLRGEEDAANQVKAADTTRRLYEQEFGEPGAGNAAYCGRAADQNSAYCGAAAGKPAEASAYCGAASAYCGAAAGKPAQPQAEATAYCGAAVGKPAEATAYCGAAAGKKAAVKQAEQSAYCGAVAAGREQATAYCGAAIHA
ncbi:hypothetical protein [Noviherbaspirillum sp.]|uniref:glycine-rich domain-containing protein n=1 Tax=Noviherbaspirillum sp. TaxID=1926288 RepID=UPI002B477487|nr:hypothetical protein [Noviherbaspirillum sp.]HJV79555.1 hypothetical protein [Noviherbaspirillum sp.]